MECVFCKIVAGEIMSYKVYEDEQTLAFLDIAPVSPGHTLVIPKKHYQNMEEIPADELVHLIVVVQKVGRAIKKSLGVAGYNITENNDPVAGQIIPHLHFHIIPRHAGDGLSLWPQGKYELDEAGQVMEKIKKVLK